MSETDDVSSSAYAQHLYHLVAYARYNKIDQHNMAKLLYDGYLGGIGKW